MIKKRNIALLALSGAFVIHTVMNDITPPQTPAEKSGEAHLRCAFSLTAYNLGLQESLSKTTHPSDQARIAHDITTTSAAYNHHMVRSHQDIPDNARWTEISETVKNAIAYEDPMNDPHAIASVPHIIGCLEQMHPH